MPRSTRSNYIPPTFDLLDVSSLYSSPAMDEILRILAPAPSKDSPSLPNDILNIAARLNISLHHEINKPKQGQKAVALAELSDALGKAIEILRSLDIQSLNLLKDEAAKEPELEDDPQGFILEYVNLGAVRVNATQRGVERLAKWAAQSSKGIMHEPLKKKRDEAGREAVMWLMELWQRTHNKIHGRKHEPALKDLLALANAVLLPVYANHDKRPNLKGICEEALGIRF